MSREDSPIRVMFVCLGNICRSPLAHAVFEARAALVGLPVSVESSGTSAYHVGEPADRRMRATASRRGVTVDHRSRQLNPEDLRDFDYVFAMDQENLRDIRRMEAARSRSGRGSSEGDGAEVRLFRDFDPQGPGDVPDPYYGGPDGFEIVYDIVDRTAEALVEELRRRSDA